jgi:hypothetical protein
VCEDVRRERASEALPSSEEAPEPAGSSGRPRSLVCESLPEYWASEDFATLAMTSAAVGSVPAMGSFAALASVGAAMAPATTTGAMTAGSQADFFIGRLLGSRAPGWGRR